MNTASSNLSTARNGSADWAANSLRWASRWSGLSLALRVGAKVVEYRFRRRLIAELEALDDHILEDIGLKRREISDYVNRRQKHRHHHFH